MEETPLISVFPRLIRGIPVHRVLHRFSGALLSNVNVFIMPSISVRPATYKDMSRPAAFYLTFHNRGRRHARGILPSTRASGDSTAQLGQRLRRRCFFRPSFQPFARMGPKRQVTPYCGSVVPPERNTWISRFGLSCSASRGKHTEVSLTNENGIDDILD